MLLLISPAKDLNFEQSPTNVPYSQPQFVEQAQQLMTICKTLTPSDLASLMKLSDKLAALNVARFASWQPSFTWPEAKQAILAFNGDVYQGLQAWQLSDSELAFAQQHLRILSGLYGLLRPLDLMHPYRLEMGTSLANEAGKDLYAFWRPVLANAINQQLSILNTDVVLNLASTEYFRAVDVKQLNATVISPEFKDEKAGQFKVISFYAKRARGLMARFVIERQLTDIDCIKTFNSAGYQYCAERSTATKPVFIRYAADLPA